MNVDLVTEAVRTVDDARNGDQIAMALIDRVRSAAAGGSDRAKATSKIMHQYIEKHPVTNEDDFGADPILPRRVLLDVDDPATTLSALRSLATFPKGLGTGQTRLLHGPALTNDRLDFMAAALSPEERDAFFVGFQCPHENVAVQVTFEHWRDVGQCVALARALQLFVRGMGPMSGFSKDVAWELGEDVKESPDEKAIRRVLFASSPPPSPKAVR